MKIYFRPKEFNKPDRALSVLAYKVKKGIKNKEKIDLPSYYSSFTNISEVYEKQNNITELNKKSKQFAETLVNLGSPNLAGIIYSVLIKINKSNPEIVEQLATNALAIAKRFNDNVHIMARCENLARIYEKREFGSHKHIKTLYTEKKSLAEICKDYDKTKKRFRTISTKMKPIENYEKMLSTVKLRIAEIIMHENPKEALYELEGAKSLLEKHGEGPNLIKIKNLINKLKT